MIFPVCRLNSRTDFRAVYTRTQEDSRSDVFEV